MINEHNHQRRRPSHHAPVERDNAPVIVQVNVCTKDRQPVLACVTGHRLCRKVWHAADYWRVGMYMIMPDHIHLFCTPGRIPMPSLRQWVDFWKSSIASCWPIQTADTASDDTDVVPPDAGGGGGSGFVMTESGGSASVRTGKTDDTEVVPPRPFKLWQRDFWDTQMRSREHYEEKLSYVRMNPVRKELVGRPDDWPYCGRIFPVAWL